MSLAAMGCNPDDRWTISNNVIAGDNPDHAAALGTLAFSPAGQMCVCVQADGAVGANKLAAIEAGWQADQVAGTQNGARLGAATAAFADNEYGWLVVWGNATLTAGGAIAAGASLKLDTSETGDVVSQTDGHATGMHANVAIADNATGSCQLMFPAQSEA